MLNMSYTLNFKSAFGNQKYALSLIPVPYPFFFILRETLITVLKNRIQNICLINPFISKKCTKSSVILNKTYNYVFVALDINNLNCN